jgi:hypothetical protein
LNFSVQGHVISLLRMPLPHTKGHFKNVGFLNENVINDRVTGVAIAENPDSIEHRCSVRGAAKRRVVIDACRGHRPANTSM